MTNIDINEARDIFEIFIPGARESSLIIRSMRVCKLEKKLFSSPAEARSTNSSIIEFFSRVYLKSFV